MGKTKKAKGKSDKGKSVAVADKGKSVAVADKGKSVAVPEDPKGKSVAVPEDPKGTSKAMIQITRRINVLQRKKTQIERWEGDDQKNLNPEFEAIRVLTDLKTRAEDGNGGQEVVETRLKTLLNESISQYLKQCELSLLWRSYKELQQLQEFLVPPVSDTNTPPLSDKPPLSDTPLPETKDLVNLLYLGNLCSRRSQRLWISNNVEGITDDDLLPLSTLSHVIVPSSLELLWKLVRDTNMPVSYVTHSFHKEDLEFCIEAAEKFLSKSNDLIKGSSNSYAKVADTLNTLLASDYINTQDLTIKPDFSMANICVLWDFDMCKLPKTKNPARMVESIRSTLRSLKYLGSIEYHGFGSEMDLTQLRNLSGANVDVNIFPKTQTRVPKSVADKMIIVETVKWIFKSLISLEEPQVLVLITGDVDIISAMEEVIENSFPLILIYKDSAPHKFVLKASELSDYLYPWSDYADDDADDE